jgi:hypothetical protein
MKYAGVVTDDSYWEAIDDNNILDVLEAMKCEAIEKAIRDHGWVE